MKMGRPAPVSTIKMAREIYKKGQPLSSSSSRGAHYKA
jgi:hypothetical protein